MIALTEDLAKACLGARGLPVPVGFAVDSAADSVRRAEALGGSAVVKALVPAGRRGLAGAVRLVRSPEAAGEACSALLGSRIGEYLVEQVYVEALEPISSELYLSFTLDRYPPRVVASAHGGVDIEQTHRERPELIHTLEIDPIDGLSASAAMHLWERCGVQSALLPSLATLTAGLWQAFVAADALMMEVNPLAVCADGRLSIVGAMLGVDDAALARHPQWQAMATRAATRGGRRANERERLVLEANARSPGAVFRYTELDGDIGFFVGGGGASLFQHDLMLAFGARPANHLDATPGGGWKEKMAAVLDAILARPDVRGLLISYNFLQLINVDERMRMIIDHLKARAVDPARLPIVIRLFGPGEDRARAIAEELPGLVYMPPMSPMEDAVAKIVELTGGPRAGADAPAQGPR
jgi:succinyl-CoA synthetase beta subunit